MRRRSLRGGLGFDPRLRIGRLQDRLFVAGPLAEHAVEPEPDKHRDQREDDDNGQNITFSLVIRTNIMRVRHRFKDRRLARSRHCTLFDRLLGARQQRTRRPSGSPTFRI